MRYLHIPLLLLVALASVNCHPGPVVGGGPKPSVGGTIAGIVSSGTNVAVAGRKVTAVEATTGAKYDATTGTNGGYTIRVPEGHYRLEVEVRPGETVAKQPAETRITSSDLDTRRDFVINGAPTSGK